MVDLMLIFFNINIHKLLIFFELEEKIATIRRGLNEKIIHLFSYFSMDFWNFLNFSEGCVKYIPQYIGVLPVPFLRYYHFFSSSNCIFVNC